MSSPTPGPWRVVDYDDDPIFDGHCLCIETDETHIAFSFDDAPSNAQLIAAAPDLLAACKNLLAAAQCNYQPDIALREYGEAARRAIAKAERIP